MQQAKTPFFNWGIFTSSPVYLLLAISGLSFCFFLGFPFDNHNESFRWIPLLDKASFIDTFTRDVTIIESFRPLGMANALLGYRLTGNIYLQQILNWVFAISSFILLFSVVKNKLLFSLLSFITGAVFFAGYIYLFHLHGVFYGPFQLYVAALTCIAFQYRRLPTKILVLVSAATIVACLYHTFALLIFFAFITGYMLQLSKKDNKILFVRLGIVLLLTVGLAKIILQAKAVKTVQALTDGFLVSYKMSEVNKDLSLVAAVLCILAALPLAKSFRNKMLATVGIIVLSAVCMYLHFPVLILWVAICLVRTMADKNWAMSGLIAAAAILPIGSSSGSPTYVVFVLMICTFITATNEQIVIPDYPVLRKLTLASVILLFGCLLALKSGVQVPVISSVAKPILAEEEKTHQFDNIIAWKLDNKSYAAYSLNLFDEMDLPVNSTNTISRANRPVAFQSDLDRYLDSASTHTNEPFNAFKKTHLYVTFGDEILEGKELVYAVEGKWNGKACVFR